MDNSLSPFLAIRNIETKTIILTKAANYSTDLQSLDTCTYTHCIMDTNRIDHGKRREVVPSLCHKVQKMIHSNQHMT